MASEIETRLFINNEFVPAKSGKTFQLFNPATEEPTVQVAEAGKEDVEEAVQHAKGAWGEWFDRDASDRSAALVALGELIVKNTAKFAELEAISMGTPTVFYHMQTAIASKLLNYFAGIAGDVHGESSLMSKGHLNFTLKQPYGVVAAIIPWNVPILMALNKIAPAVAAGNAIIMKSSEKAPLTSILLAQLIRETGLFPPGIVQILSGGRESGEALASHMEIRKIAFTGSARTGQAVKCMAANSNMKACTLELGGKAPVILFDDGNVEKAASESAVSVAFNSGQTCTSVARIYVQENILDAFMAAFRPAFEGFLTNFGDPIDPTITHGPQADKLQFDSVMSLIDSGKKTGTLLAGGNRRGEKGYFVEPTIFLNAPDECDVARKEIFGPVINIMTFKTEEEALARANDSEYGLFASVFTRNISRALRVAKKYESGTVTVNCTSHYQAVDMAFGGVKGSGDGREYGRWGLNSWLETKSVLIDLND